MTTALIALPLKTEAAPTVIDLEFTEVDRQTADAYPNRDHCIIATALRNRGYNVNSVGAFVASLNSEDDNWVIEYLTWSPDSIFCRTRIQPDGTFYLPSIVGKKTRLTKLPHR